MTGFFMCEDCKTMWYPKDGGDRSCPMCPLRKRLAKAEAVVETGWEVLKELRLIRGARKKTMVHIDTHKAFEEALLLNDSTKEGGA